MTILVSNKTNRPEAGIAGLSVRDLQLTGFKPVVVEHL